VKSGRVYVASSWRNSVYDDLIERIRLEGYEVWNWRQPPTGGNGFKWQDTGAVDYQHGDKIAAEEWRRMLQHPIAQTGFASDLAGMYWCDAGVLLHPCGNWAHLEAGVLAGFGKKVHVLALEPVVPDLMVLALRGGIYGTVGELLYALNTQ
jgi:hypothetical protein